jgi:ribose 5-phosphate isomerase RpiB
LTWNKSTYTLQYTYLGAKGNFSLGTGASIVQGVSPNIVTYSGILSATANDSATSAALLLSQTQAATILAGNSVGAYSTVEGSVAGFFKSYGTNFSSGYQPKSISQFSSDHYGAIGTVYWDNSAVARVNGTLGFVDGASVGDAGTPYGGYFRNAASNANSYSYSLQALNSHAGEWQWINGGSSIVSFAYIAGGSVAPYYAVHAVTSNSSDVYLAYNNNGVYCVTGGVALNGQGFTSFTGAHDALISNTEATEIALGDIVVDAEIVAIRGVNDAAGIVTRSTAPMQTNVLGVASEFKSAGSEYKPYAFTMDTYETNEHQEGFTSTQLVLVMDPKYNSYFEANQVVLINGVGEGLINVTNEGGNITAGDYICSSSTPGKGMRQPDDLMHSYTVAKARMSYTFTGTEIATIACTYHCG